MNHRNKLPNVKCNVVAWYGTGFLRYYVLIKVYFLNVPLKLIFKGEKIPLSKKEREKKSSWVKYYTLKILAFIIKLLAQNF